MNIEHKSLKILTCDDHLKYGLVVVKIWIY